MTREYPGTHWFDEEEERAVVDGLRKDSVFRYYGPGQPSTLKSWRTRPEIFTASVFKGKLTHRLLDIFML